MFQPVTVVVALWLSGSKVLNLPWLRTPWHTSRPCQPIVLVLVHVGVHWVHTGKEGVACTVHILYIFCPANCLGTPLFPPVRPMAWFCGQVYCGRVRAATSYIHVHICLHCFVTNDHEIHSTPPPPPPHWTFPSLAQSPSVWGGGGLLPQKSTAPHAPNENHLEERLLDQAQARTPYTPAWGVIRVAYPKAWYWMFNPL